MNSTRQNITKFSKNNIINIIKQNPILIGNTYTAKQFFETDYEYDLTNCDIIGKPILSDIDNIEKWEDVQILNNNNEIQNLVNPGISTCSYFTVHVK